MPRGIKKEQWVDVPEVLRLTSGKEEDVLICLSNQPFYHKGKFHTIDVRNIHKDESLSFIVGNIFVNTNEDQYVMGVCFKPESGCWELASHEGYKVEKTAATIDL